MLYRHALISTSFLLALACVACSEAVEVKVQPTKFVVGADSYDSEKAAVDELLRRTPHNIRIQICPDTPIDRIMKFNRERSQRLEIKAEIFLTEKGC